MPAIIPRAAYVHVPFCRHRCGYCNFTLLAGRDDLIESYLTAIEREMSWLGKPREVDTLFFGGGTPTHLSPRQLERLLSAAGEWFPLAAGGEISVEANPADMNEQRAAVLAEQGVSRLSLGGQSFDRQKLGLLERDHDGEQIRRAVELARRFAASVSLDLIFAAPGETAAAWRRDIESALELIPDHLSTYGLTFERGTQFWSRRRKGELSPVEEETERAMYLAAIDRLSAAGYEHYEVSSFARAGHRCRHNETYWKGGGYFAAGPGAARFVGGVRETNHRSTTIWLSRVLAGESPVAEREQLDPEPAARERLVFGLRRLEGIELECFAEETGFDARELGGGALQSFLAAGLLALERGRLRLTREGLLVSDSIWPELI